ncbi:MAG: DUF805 domain-containing protein [Firmicutes bacterium]|nr:DUF805 domain-containing protein [Bacillota bacterium]
MICSQCRLRYEDDEKTCPYCGHPNPMMVQKEMVTAEENQEYNDVKHEKTEQKYFFRAFLNMYKRYFDFSGTTGRGEYWSVQLLLVIILLPFISIYMGVDPELITLTYNQAIIVDLTALYLVVSIIPIIALTVRRLHDANLTGFLYLFTFIPGAGSLIVMILTILPYKENKYEVND